MMVGEENAEKSRLLHLGWRAKHPREVVGLRAAQKPVSAHWPEQV